MKLYVGNLPNQLNEEQLSSEFLKFGDIREIKIIRDRLTGISRGFGFIDMSDIPALIAIEALNNYAIYGRQITVKEAYERKQATRREYPSRKGF